MITMTDEYAFSGSPGVKQRVICVDRPGDYPVLVMSPDGTLRSFGADGRHSPFEKESLVPLVDEPTLQISPGVYDDRVGWEFYVLTVRAPGNRPIVGYNVFHDTLGNPYIATRALYPDGRLYNSGINSDVDLVARIRDLP